MAEQVQLRRGTTAEHSSFTGAVGEVTVDTDKKVPVVHDGSTAGGLPLPQLHAANTWALGQTITAGGLSVTAGGITITAGGLTVTAGGLTVSAGGASITGNSTVTGTLGVSNTTAGGGATTTYTNTTQSRSGVFGVIDHFNPGINAGASSAIVFQTDSTEQLRITHTASANRYVTITGSNGANPTIGTSAGSLVISTNAITTGYSHVLSNTATPAGGALATALFLGSAQFGVFFGSGAPTVSAAKGSLYLRSDGSGTSDRMYVNTDGGTTWTAVTTAA